MAHATLGPSNHRWPNCPGSVREEAGYVDVAGEAAVDGTGSHLLLEMCLLNGCRAEDYLGQIIGVNSTDNPNGWMIHQDRVDRVQMCLDYVMRRNTELSTEYTGAVVNVETESRSNPGGISGHNDWWGTVDITITVVLDGKVVFIEVCDYKDGRGWVSEKGNSQLEAYCIGKLRPYIAAGPDLVRPLKPVGIKVRMSIVQPKTTPPVRYEDTDDRDMINRFYVLDSAASEARRKDAPLVAGKHCQWCKANMKRGGHCSVSAEAGIQKVKMMTEITNATGGDVVQQLQTAVANVKLLTAEQLASVLDIEEPLLSAFKALRNEAELRLSNGGKLPGYSMRPGRSSRVWAEDEETIAKKLRSRKLTNAEIYPQKLASPAQIMKCDKLDTKQRERLEKELIVTKAGELKLTRVARGEEKNAEELFKDVAQVDTNVIPFNPNSKSLFDDKTEEELSFI